MQIRRFKAATMAEAVRKVKDELGPDALVLSTRKLRKAGGTFGLFGRPMVELTAAVDRQRRRHGEDAPVQTAAAFELDPASAAAVHSSSLEAELRLMRQQLEVFGDSALSPNELRSELSQLRLAIAELKAVQHQGTAGSDREAERLGCRGLAARHAAVLGMEARQLESDEALTRAAAVSRVLAQRLDARLEVPRADDPARAHLFVGAPGVGKTTTLAKLAAREEQREAHTSLITTDTFRIGAEEQLKIYAALLQVPVVTAPSAGDILRELERSTARRVYVDTAGRGRRDPDALKELLRIRGELGPRSRVSLVIAATTKPEDLRAQVQHFSPLRPDSTIVTKVDESDDLSNVVNLLLDDDCPPLLWLATGQHVPEDLEVPDPTQICQWVQGRAA